MKPVIQEETTGCGIAASATILQRGYAEVKARANALGIHAEDERLFSETDHIRTLLRDYGVAVADCETPFVSWQQLPDLALLAIKHHYENDRPYWHWVVFRRSGDEAVVFDSAPNLEHNTRRDFSAMAPKWFIAVTPPES